MASEASPSEAGQNGQDQKPAKVQGTAKPAVAPRPKAKKAKPEQPADPRFKPFTDGYCTTYRRVFGSSYVHGGGKDGKKLKEFLASTNPQEFSAEWLLSIACMAMERSCEPFPDAAKFATSIFGFCDHFNAIRAKVQTSVAEQKTAGKSMASGAAKPRAELPNYFAPKPASKLRVAPF